MRERVRGYADAIFEASVGHIGKIADELQGFADLLASSTDLAWAMENPVTPVPTKRAIIQQLLGRKLSAPVLDLVNFVLGSGPGEDLGTDLASLAALSKASFIRTIYWTRGRSGGSARPNASMGTRRPCSVPCEESAS